jgi:hypothetical protein
VSRVSAPPSTAGGPSGYSHRSQAEKLGIKPRFRIALDHPPPDWSPSGLPDDIVFAGPREGADVVVSFFVEARELPDRLPALVERIQPSGALWVAWPRRAGGHHSDITDDIVRRVALPLGVVDVKVAAIDDDWSGLRLVWRRADRKPS